MTVPMIHAGALGRMPEFIAGIAGWDSVERAFAAVGLPSEIVEHVERRIPWHSVAAFVERGASLVGDDEFGLELSRHASIRTYGTWGRYLTSAPSLGEALARLERTIAHHSPEDSLTVLHGSRSVVVRYRFAVLGGFGSDNTSYCAAGALISFVREYLGESWTPDRLWLPVRPRAGDSRVVQNFGCDVVLGCDAIALAIPARLLDTPRPPSTRPVCTLADVERARRAVPARDLHHAVADVLWAQLLEDAPSIERVARTLDIGPRSLQRRLAVEGTSFREIERMIVIGRARELLADTDRSITQVAVALSYASTGHFSRAFARATGQTPSGFRKAALPEQRRQPDQPCGGDSLAMTPPQAGVRSSRAERQP